MERVSPIADLSVLTCVFIATLSILPLLPLRYIRLRSFPGLCRQPQTWITISKFNFDLALVILHALDISSMVLHGGRRLLLTVDLLLRLSITCATSLEFLYLWNTFERASQTGLGRFWRRTGPSTTLALTLLKFLPFIGWQEETLQFYTVFGASLLDFLLFSLIYGLTLIGLHNDRKWRSCLAGCLMRCVAVATLALISLVIGWRVPWIRRLLLEVFLLLITTQLSLQCGYIERKLAAQNRPGFTLHSDNVTATRMFSTEDCAIALYARTQSSIQVMSHPTPLESSSPSTISQTPGQKVVRMESNDLHGGGDDQRPDNIACSGAKPSNLDSVIRDPR